MGELARAPSSAVAGCDAGLLPGPPWSSVEVELAGAESAAAPASAALLDVGLVGPSSRPELAKFRKPESSDGSSKLSS